MTGPRPPRYTLDCEKTLDGMSGRIIFAVGPGIDQELKLRGPFSSEAELRQAAEVAFKHFINGTGWVDHPQRRERIGVYTAIVTAWPVDQGMWCAGLEMIRREPPNKATRQARFAKRDPFERNLRASAEAAHEFGLEFARKLVASAVPGLSI